MKGCLMRLASPGFKLVLKGKYSTVWGVLRFRLLVKSTDDCGTWEILLHVHLFPSSYYATKVLQWNQITRLESLKWAMYRY